MPYYTVECPECCLRSEHNLGMNDSLDDRLDCPMCEGTMCRRHDRIYDIPQIQGDTVAGGCSYNYYDDGLGEHVKSKGHREDLMKAKGLEEYTPDPTMKKHRDEARYIKERSNVLTDPDAAAAVRKEYKTAESKRRTRLVEKSMDKSFKDMGVE